MFYLGCLAFALFFLADCNDAKLHSKFLIFSFPLGVILLIIATFMQLNINAAPISDLFGQIILWTIFSIFAGLEIYTLFFSFPADLAYGSPGTKRPVCTTGVYAVCRHPGVIWLIGAYLCLWLAAGFPLYAVIIYSLLNMALVTFEDIYVFPRVLSGYKDYKSTTPFLIPNPKSINTALGNKAD